MGGYWAHALALACIHPTETTAGRDSVLAAFVASLTDPVLQCIYQCLAASSPLVTLTTALRKRGLGLICVASSFFFLVVGWFSFLFGVLCYLLGLILCMVG